jgi:hypothetical protein
MTPRTALVLAIVGLHTMFACSRSDNAVSGTSTADSAAATTPSSPPRTGSCDRVTTMSVCSEYSGSYLALNEAVLSATCVKLGGAFVRAQCPNTSVLGTCTLATGEVRKFYSSGGAAYDLAKAAKECTGPYTGTWAVYH